MPSLAGSVWASTVSTSVREVLAHTLAAEVCGNTLYIEFLLFSVQLGPFLYFYTVLEIAIVNKK
jgi:hypothetical protein